MAFSGPFNVLGQMFSVPFFSKFSLVAVKKSAFQREAFTWDLAVLSYKCQWNTIYVKKLAHNWNTVCEPV